MRLLVVSAIVASCSMALAQDVDPPIPAVFRPLPAHAEPPPPVEREAPAPDSTCERACRERAQACFTGCTPADGSQAARQATLACHRPCTAAQTACVAECAR